MIAQFVRAMVLQRDLLNSGQALLLANIIFFAQDPRPERILL